MTTEPNARQAVATGAEDREQEIDLLELLHVLLGSLKFIVLAAVIGGALLGGYSYFFATPMYASTASMYVISSRDSVVDLSSIQIGSYLTADYQEVLKTWEVNERVRENLGLSYTRQQLEEMMTIENPTNTRIISIEIKSENPQEAASIANEYAEVASAYIAETMITDKPNILSVALPAEFPYSPNIMRNGLIGLLLGGLAAAAVFTVRYVLNDKIMSADDIDKYIGIATLAVVPLLSEDNKVDLKKTVVHTKEKSVEA